VNNTQLVSHQTFGVDTPRSPQVFGSDRHAPTKISCIIRHRIIKKFHFSRPIPNLQQEIMIAQPICSQSACLKSIRVDGIDEISAILESVSDRNLAADSEIQSNSLSLSSALEKLADFAQAHQLNSLRQFAIAELEGYTNNTYPNYRVVELDYFDIGGQALPQLKPQYASYPLLNGLVKLELHLKNGLALNLPAPVLNFLSQAANREVRGGHVSPSQLLALLKSVRDAAIGKLNEISGEF
jgi:hypothetical protein